jgi:hypothetical protein
MNFIKYMHVKDRTIKNSFALFLEPAGRKALWVIFYFCTNSMVTMCHKI